MGEGLNCLIISWESEDCVRPFHDKGVGKMVFDVDIPVPLWFTMDFSRLLDK